MNNQPIPDNHFIKTDDTMPDAPWFNQQREWKSIKIGTLLAAADTLVEGHRAKKLRPVGESGPEVTIPLNHFNSMHLRRINSNGFPLFIAPDLSKFR